MGDQPRILGAVAVGVFVLHQRNRFEAAADRHAHAVADDLLGGDGDRHQARGALPVDRHAGHRGRQAGAQRGLARDVHRRSSPAASPRPSTTSSISAGSTPAALDRLADRMAAERLRLGVVEGAAIGAPDRRARGRDDDGFPHHGAPGCGSLTPSARAAFSTNLNVWREGVVERTRSRCDRRSRRSAPRSSPACARPWRGTRRRSPRYGSPRTPRRRRRE